MILSSKLPVIFANIGKKDTLDVFISDYRDAVEFYIDYLWNLYELDKQKYKNLRKFANIKDANITSDLSARALKCASTQALGMIKSRTKKLSKIQYIIKKKQKKKEDTSKLQRKYDKLLNNLHKPNGKNVFPELCSNCCEFLPNKTKLFNGFIHLHCLGKKYGKLLIPIKFNKHSNYLASLGKQLNSFLITKTDVQFRYNIEVDEKTTGVVEGADQGITTCLTLSDGQTTPKDIHGNDLKSICKKISRKKKGSKSFLKAQEHRKNYINWCIKQLILNNIKQINLEKLRNVGKGQRRTRYLQSFAHKQIRTALKKTCFLAGVHVEEQSNFYRSQRCNQCGYVHKSNRHGKLFKCKHCGHVADADLNAAMNHRDSLCDLSFRSYRLPNKTEGFFWKPDGIYFVDGSEFTVPVAKKKK